MSEKEPHLTQEVLQAIAETWAQFPSLRLTQLLVSAINPSQACPDIFYVEDSRLVQLLEEFRQRHA